jgi:hypothetical protein
LLANRTVFKLFVATLPIFAKTGKNAKDYFTIYSQDALELKEIRYGLSDLVLEMLADLYPNGRFVFIVCHPVDVVASKISAWIGDGIETDAHRRSPP